MTLRMLHRLKILRLEEDVRALGFEGLESALRAWYTEERLGLVRISRRLHISEADVRYLFEVYHIALRKRGGPNNVKVVLTADTVREVHKDGLSAVCQRLGVDMATMIRQLKDAGLYQKGRKA